MMQNQENRPDAAAARRGVSPSSAGDPPRLAYWKFGPEYLEGDRHLEAVRRFFSASGLNLLVILMDLAERGYNHPEAMRRLREMVTEAHRCGGRLAFGVDIRYLARRLADTYPGDRYGVAEVVTARLDEAGAARLAYRAALGRQPAAGLDVLRALAFARADACHYRAGSLRDVTARTRIERAPDDPAAVVLVVEAGPACAGLDVAVVPHLTLDRLDLFSDRLLPEYAALMDRFDDVPLDGMTVDEMGFYIPHDPGHVVRKFHYSAPLAAAYRRRTGRDLADDLPVFRLAPDDDDGVRHRAINAYFELLRLRAVEIERFVYDETRRRCGPGAFVGLHPTFWNESAHEAFHDGFDWWDVPRDYAQTDEAIIMPTRLALSRKAGPVWYNMWYTNRELRMESYFRETWRYAEFGGRTHYHSYITHSEKDLVGEIHRPGDLERVAVLESLIARLNRFQATQPDARVAVVMGYASMVNWALTEPALEALPPDRGRFLEGCRFAQGLLEQGWLCDFIPDYELEHGELDVREGRVRYGTQTYDALVWLFPECAKPAVLEAWQRIRAVTDHIVVAGGCRWRFDGAPDTGAFAAFTVSLRHTYAEPPAPAEVARILRGWGVPGNRFANGCRYQDGSAIFVAGGDRPSGNPLRVDAVLDGRRIEAEGADLLAIRLAGDGTVAGLVSGGLSFLRVDGRAVARLEDHERQSA